MTTLVKQNQIWNSMPGWGIVADLTPPELIAGRKLRFVRKVLALGLIVLAVVLTGAFVLARMQTSSASDALAQEQLRTTQLTAQQSKYSEVTQVQTSITTAQREIAGLMATDIDTSALIGTLRSSLPASMTLAGINLQVIKANATTGSSATAGTLDTSGHKPVATIILLGHSRSIPAIASYVDALRQVTGVVDVVPATAQNTGTDVTFTINLTLTDQGLSHNFDVKTGSK